MKLPRFGKKALREVKTALAERGWNLGSISSDLSFSSNVNSLNLSARVRNTLHNEDIHTIEDLTSRTEEQLRRLPDFGEKAFNKVKEALAIRKLSLKI